jgi:nucleoid-associated protein YgaU
VAEAPPAERVHVVVSGDTLGAIAKTYYGKASLYPKIFDANRDVLDDPNRIKPGQVLRIPG